MEGFHWLHEINHRYRVSDGVAIHKRLSVICDHLRCKNICEEQFLCADMMIHREFVSRRQIVKCRCKSPNGDRADHEAFNSWHQAILSASRANLEAQHPSSLIPSSMMHSAASKNQLHPSTRWDPFEPGPAHD